MKIAAIITAAGRGTRAGGDLPKQWQMLAGEPVLAHTLRAFAGMQRVLVIHPDDQGRADDLLRGLSDIRIVTGGATRALSVRAALESLAADPPDLVLIHDGARPFPSARVIGEVIRALHHASAAAPALPVSDALWIGREGRVVGVQDRTGLFRAQTPQGFAYAAILAAHRAYGADAADDVEIARAAGLAVMITQGDEDNLKLTYPDDFARAEAILGKSAARVEKRNAD